MKKQKVQILTIEQLTHDVKSFRLEKPEGMDFEPGQATEISIDRDGWREEGRPFTITSLRENEYLEFIIKKYPSHQGVTQELHTLEEGDSLILTDIFGTIKFRGVGLFIAGGTGITPFISIFRDLKHRNKLEGNKLLFANKTSSDIILEDELRKMFGEHLINVLSEEKQDRYIFGYISRELIMDQLTVPGMNVYVCGPPPMMKLVKDSLSELEIPEEAVVTEEF